MSEKIKQRTKKRDYKIEMERKPIYSVTGDLSVPFQRAASVTTDAEERIREKYKDRGRSGREQAEKEIEEVNKQFYKDADLTEEYGKDAYKSKSFGVRKFSEGGMVYGKSFKGIF